MGLIPTLNTFMAGTPIVASAMNSNFEKIVTVVNGGLDDSNISQISTSKVTSGEFDPDRIPRLSEDKLPQAAQGFLKAKGAATDPAYELVQWEDVQDKPVQATRWPTWDEVTTGKPSTFPPTAHSHNAGDIDEGRLELARMPTSDTVNRFLKVVEVGATPIYGTVFWSDIQGKPSAYTPLAHTHSVGQLPVGSNNNTQVAPGQDMSGSGDARHPVGAVRLIHAAVSPGGTVTAGTLMTGARLATLSATKVELTAYPSQESITADVISIGDYWDSPTLPGGWTILSQVDSPIVGGPAGGAPGLALAVRLN